MTAEVVSLDSHRRNHKQPATCACGAGFTCYPHRLVDLMARMDDLRSDVDQLRFCDLGTFNRLTADISDVLGGIVSECLPDERNVR